MSDRPRRALITGITGQDGTFLAEELIGRDYEVIGLTRRDPGGDLGWLESLRDRVRLLRGDALDPAMLATIADARPAEIYHLAAPTFVQDSWRDPAGTMSAIHGSAAALLGLVSGELPGTRLFLAGSSEMFGDAAESPQRELTPARPRNPYATAKLAAHELAGQLRARDGAFVVSGILYNHESERRPRRFVTRKITRAAAEIARGSEQRLELGDLSAIRDWSFAGDIMHAAWLSLQSSEPDDYIFASGVGHTVADLLQAAFGHVGLDPAAHVDVDRELVRPPEIVAPVGDPTLARERLGWTPQIGFAQLIGRMVDADLAALAGSSPPAL